MLLSSRGFALTALALLGTGCPKGIGDPPQINPPVEEQPPPTKTPVPPAQLGPTVMSAQPLRPISGGTLTMLKDGQTVVAADPDRDHLFFADLTERAVMADFPLPGDEPGRSVEDATGTVHVVLRRAGALLSLQRSTTGWSIVARRPVCAAPRGIAYEVHRDLLHVACAEGALVSLPAAGGEPTRTLSLPNDLRDVVASGDVLYVSRFRSAEIIVVGADGAVIAQQRPPRLDQPDGSSTAAVAWRMIPRGDRGALVVHQYALDGVVQTIAGGYGGSPSSCAQLVESAVSLVGPDGSIQPVLHLRRAVLPVDVATDAEGTRLAVVAAGNAHNGEGQVLLAPDIAPAPVNCGMDGASPTTPAQGEVVAAVFAPDGRVVVQTREPATVQVLGDGPISLSRESRADTGHMLFHGAAGAPLACASCHPEGGDDGHVWTFDKSGARRTQSLRGGISGTAPFHWDGDLPGLPQLYAEVLTKRMSGPQLDAGQQQALTHFIDGIPTLPAADPTDAATRGQALFLRQGCTSCHGGAALTSNLTVDVGTGAAFQVPSLRGVRWRGPYLHDGCAATLADRFGPCGGGDRHGMTSTLSSAEIADLVAYLETL